MATTYQHMGLLPTGRPASWYDPGRFWSGDRIELVPPFVLGGEVAVAYLASGSVSASTGASTARLK